MKNRYNRFPPDQHSGVRLNCQVQGEPLFKFGVIHNICILKDYLIKCRGLVSASQVSHNPILFLCLFQVEVQIPSSPKPNQRAAQKTGTDGVAGLFPLPFFINQRLALLLDYY